MAEKKKGGFAGRMRGKNKAPNWLDSQRIVTQGGGSLKRAAFSQIRQNHQCDGSPTEEWENKKSLQL